MRLITPLRHGRRRSGDCAAAPRRRARSLCRSDRDDPAGGHCRSCGRTGLERRIGLLRRSAHDRRGDPRGGGGFPRLPRAAVAAGGAPRHCAQRLCRLHRAADARPAHHGSARRPARVHQIVLGLSRSPGERRAHRSRAARCWRNTRKTFDAVERAYGVDRYIIAAIWGVETDYGTHGRRPPGDPLDRHARLHRPPAELFPRGIPLGAGNPRSAATSSRTGWSAHGPAPSARPSSCRPRSSATRSISTATAAATWSNSVPDIIASTANNLKKDGWVSGQTWGYEVVVPATFNFMLADHARAMTIRDWERLGIARPAASRSRVRTTAPSCWCRPACRGPAS